VATCDVDSKRAAHGKAEIEKFYQERGESKVEAKAYGDFREVMARDDIDAVVIAVPEHWHAIIAIAACHAGKDVYCEKPLSLTIHEAHEMVRAVRRHDTVFQTGSQQRSDGNFRRACELVRSGRIGEIKSVNVGVGPPSWEPYLPEEPIPPGLDFDRWLGPAPWVPFNKQRIGSYYEDGWRRFRDYSGGKMTDWGAHHFDIAQWGLGMDGTQPVEITPPDEARGTPLTYRYANGVMMYHGGANGVLFTGTDGKIEVNRGYFRAWPDKIGKSPIGPSDVHLPESPGHHQDWLRCIRTRRRPLCDVEIGASSITVCHLGNLAWWLGRTLHWDPQQQQFINDEAANRWLDRPKRAPYLMPV